MPTAEQALPGREAKMPVAARHFVLDAPLEGPFPDDTQMAMFGLGCFWGAERKFWETKGVFTTAVGYAAGQTPNPTYEEVCSGLTGHNEVVLVVYRPAEVSYEDLLKLFWESHDPTQGMRQGADRGTQYRSGVYCFDDVQRQTATESMQRYQRAARGCRIRPHHDRDPRRAALLLCGGLPPAVPCKEPGRVLRPGWHRCRMPHEARSDLRPAS